MEELLDLHENLHDLEGQLLHKHEEYAKHLRLKRELTANLFDNPDVLNESDENKKNSSSDAISKVIQEIQDTLETLELKFVEHDWSANDTAKTSTKLTSAGFVRGSKFPKVGGRVGTRCYIESETGKVNCSDVIYDDEKTWRKSRSQIDMLIKVLKDKITHLKDIKKQLRETKQQQQHNRYWNNEFATQARDADTNADLPYITNEYQGSKVNRRRRPYNYHHPHHHGRHYPNGVTNTNYGLGNRRKLANNTHSNNYSHTSRNIHIDNVSSYQASEKQRNNVPNMSSTTTTTTTTTPQHRGETKITSNYDKGTFDRVNRTFQSGEYEGRLLFIIHMRCCNTIFLSEIWIFKIFM